LHAAFAALVIAGVRASLSVARWRLRRVKQMSVGSTDVTALPLYTLRRPGRRLPWREVANATPFEGDLSTYYLTLKNERYFVAQLFGPGDAFRKLLLPEFYEPVLTRATACSCCGDSSARVRRLAFRGGDARSSDNLAVGQLSGRDRLYVPVAESCRSTALSLLCCPSS
jgi:hypothetical protein